MFDKKLIVSNHVKQRFMERNIKFSRKRVSIEDQIKHDLKVMNTRKIEKINQATYKVTTRQGKVYIIEVINDKVALIKTVYKIDLKKEMLA